MNSIRFPQSQNFDDFDDEEFAREWAAGRDAVQSTAFAGRVGSDEPSQERGVVSAASAASPASAPEFAAAWVGQSDDTEVAAAAVPTEEHGFAAQWVGESADPVPADAAEPRDAHDESVQVDDDLRERYAYFEQVEYDEVPAEQEHTPAVAALAGAGATAMVDSEPGYQPAPAEAAEAPDGDRDESHPVGTAALGLTGAAAAALAAAGSWLGARHQQTVDATVPTAVDEAPMHHESATADHEVDHPHDLEDADTEAAVVDTGHADIDAINADPQLPTIIDTTRTAVDTQSIADAEPTHLDETGIGEAEHHQAVQPEEEQPKEEQRDAGPAEAEQSEAEHHEAEPAEVQTYSAHSTEHDEAVDAADSAEPPAADHQLHAAELGLTGAAAAALAAAGSWLGWHHDAHKAHEDAEDPDTVADDQAGLQVDQAETDAYVDDDLIAPLAAEHHGIEGTDSHDLIAAINADPELPTIIDTTHLDAESTTADGTEAEESQLSTDDHDQPDAEGDISAPVVAETEVVAPHRDDIVAGQAHDHIDAINADPQLPTIIDTTRTVVDTGTDEAEPHEAASAEVEHHEGYAAGHAEHVEAVHGDQQTVTDPLRAEELGLTGAAAAALAAAGSWLGWHHHAHDAHKDHEDAEDPDTVADDQAGLQVDQAETDAYVDADLIAPAAAEHHSTEGTDSHDLIDAINADPELPTIIDTTRTAVDTQARADTEPAHLGETGTDEAGHHEAEDTEAEQHEAEQHEAQPDEAEHHEAQPAEAEQHEAEPEEVESDEADPTDHDDHTEAADNDEPPAADHPLHAAELGLTGAAAAALAAAGSWLGWHHHAHDAHKDHEDAEDTDSLADDQAGLQVDQAETDAYVDADLIAPPAAEHHSAEVTDSHDLIDAINADPELPTIIDTTREPVTPEPAAMAEAPADVVDHEARDHGEPTGSHAELGDSTEQDIQVTAPDDAGHQATEADADAWAASITHELQSAEAEQVAEEAAQPGGAGAVADAPAVGAAPYDSDTAAHTAADDWFSRAMHRIGDYFDDPSGR